MHQEQTCEYKRRFFHFTISGLWFHGLAGKHYATHDTRLMHGHRKLRLAEYFEMLPLMPDFDTSHDYVNHPDPKDISGNWGRSAQNPGGQNMKIPCEALSDSKWVKDTLPIIEGYVAHSTTTNIPSDKAFTMGKLAPIP